MPEHAGTVARIATAGLTLLFGTPLAGQEQPAKPLEAVAAIVEAFRTHELVALGDAHGNAEAQIFLRRLVSDPSFAAAVDDIVVEFGNARYQDVVDRYVRGDRVPAERLRKVWQNTTVANEIPVDERFFETVRSVNAGRPREDQLRVLLSDPPIDWSTVRTREDHFRWLAMRDSFPAALIQVEVLAKGRKALVVYGQLHFQRRQILSNFDMSDWRVQTIVSLIERASPIRVFTIWRADDDLAAIQPDVASWARPSLAVVRSTRVGAADVAALSPAGARIAFRGDGSVPIPKEEWLSLRVEEQLDAVLYLGPSAEMTEAPLSSAPCAEPGYLEERLRRIALTGIPAFEAERAIELCAGVSPRR